MRATGILQGRGGLLRLVVLLWYGLRRGEPGATFKMLHEQLSEAGANTVIAVRFLDENERGIDPQFWQRAFVFGHVGLQVSLTLRARSDRGGRDRPGACDPPLAGPHPSPWPRRWCGPANTTPEKSRGSSKGCVRASPSGYRTS